MASSWPLDPPGHPWEFSWPPPGLLLALPGPPGLPSSGSPLCSPTIHHSTLYYYSLFNGILASLRIQSELCLLFGSSLGSTTIHQTTSSYSLFIINHRDRIAGSFRSDEFGTVWFQLRGDFGDGGGWEGEGGKGGRQGSPGVLKTARGPPASFIPPWSSWPSFWLSPRLPDNPSSHLLLEPVQRDASFPRDSI